MNRGARVHFARGIRHLCYSDLLPAIFIVFQKPIKIDPPAEVSRVARFFKPAQKGRRLEVRECRLGNYCFIQYSLTVMNTQSMLGLTKMQSQSKKGTLELVGAQW